MKYLVCIICLIMTWTANAMELRATVNDTPISDLDVKNWTHLLKMQQPQVYDYMKESELKSKALESLIETTVKKQTATAAGAKVSETDIQNALDHLAEQNGLTKKELPAFLKKNGVSEATMRQQVESDLLWLHYLRTKAGHMQISDLAVNKRYQTMKKELQQKGIQGDSIMLWEMAQGVFPENVDVSTTLESKTCDAFLEHIKIGPYPESAQRGWTDPSQFPKELYDLLKEVAVGETFGPLKTPQGILVMMKCNVRSQQVMPTKDQLKMQMEMEQLDVLSRRLVAEAMRRSIIERKD